MHLAIAVIASPGKQYDEMKNVWLQNISNYTEISSHKISVYFLYGKNEGSAHFDTSNLSYNVKPAQLNVYDFFVNDLSENLRNIVTKTLIFCKYIVTDSPDKPDFILRTNLSTLFDIPKFIDLLRSVNQKCPSKHLFGGTFVHGFRGLHTWFSGTNITFSFTVAQLLLQHFFVINAFPAQDDVALSSFLVNQYPNDVCFFNIPRIDFVKDVFLQYTSLATDLSEVSCFRFKTNNRNHDTTIMKQFLDSSFDKGFIRSYILNHGKFTFTQKNELFNNPFFFQTQPNEPK